MGEGELGRIKFSIYNFQFLNNVLIFNFHYNIENCLKI